MQKRNLRWKPLTAVFLPLILTGCQLLPKEEEFPAAPMIQSYEAAQYKEATVMRGDLYQTKSIACKYKPVKKESLSFSLGGETIEGVYVTEGQQVKAGTLLAELVQDNLEGQIEELEYRLKVLALEHAHIQENRDLEVKRLDVQYPVEDWKDGTYRSKKAEIEENYNKQLQDNEDEQYIEELRLAELTEQLHKCQIRASFDGIVTFAREVTEGQRSVEKQVVVSVADMTSIVFTVSGEDAAYFPVGTEVVITVKKKEYPAVSVDASALGLAETDSDEQTAYLQLLEPDPTLEDGDTGSIAMTLDERLDTLYVDKSAVKTAEGKQFVYVLNEEGLKVMQEVTTGMESGKVIEILSGLAEGNSVILD